MMRFIKDSFAERAREAVNFDSGPKPIIIWNKTRRVYFANFQAKQLLVYTSDED